MSATEKRDLRVLAITSRASGVSPTGRGLKRSRTLGTGGEQQGLEEVSSGGKELGKNLEHGEGPGNSKRALLRNSKGIAMWGSVMQLGWETAHSPALARDISTEFSLDR